jgi:hypothetical protein
MELLKLLLEIYKEEYDLNLKEGLIKTTNIDKTLNLLKKYFPDVFITKGDKRFIISIDNPNIENIKKLLVNINNFGWFPSFFRYKTKEDNIVTNKWNDKIINIIDKLESISITFEAKFDEEIIEKIPEILYHISPTQNIDKILKVGLVPKSRSKASYHPDRVYLSNDLKDIENLGKKFNQKTGIKDWTILKIETNMVPGDYLRLYYDPNYKQGYYTLNNIPPQAIEKIKEINY